MRIISGLAKGRRLKAPRGSGTRPLTDRMRESLFSSLGAAVAGARVLDLYAGTGSFGLEALSRGAEAVTFVERDRAALAALRQNIEAVGLGGEVARGDVSAVLDGTRATFDLIMVDPPYAEDSADLEGVMAAAAEALAAGGTLLLHRRRDQVEVPTAGTLRSTGHRRHGDAVIWWYTKEEK